MIFALFAHSSGAIIGELAPLGVPPPWLSGVRKRYAGVRRHVGTRGPVAASAKAVREIRIMSISKSCEVSGVRANASALWAGAAVIAMLTAPNAASAQSCRDDFESLSSQRQALIRQVQSFKSKRTTATGACNVLTQLTNHDRKMLKWMEDNRDWCQIPEQAFEGMKGSGEQIVTARGNACTVAKKEQAAIAKAKRDAAQGGGQSALPGAGVRLPQGAL